ncbi:MAG: hypothetical protein PHG97_00145 [Candidatus Margulisbacteria bacterium]|nr:hypothetical protein [Candidatus Margulisiibacteriota bacterium]
MLNIIDLVIVAFVLFYLLKNAGGILRTVKNLVVVLLIIIFFGIAARLTLNSSFISGEARKTLENAYFVKLSNAMIAWGYPALQDNAPKVDSFIKEQIISTPEVKTQKIESPRISIPEKELDKLLEEIAKPEKKK